MRAPLLRNFGRTGHSFPEVGLGTWTFSGKDFGPIAAAHCESLVRAALEMGIRFVDTADVYGYGAVESLIARALDGRAQDAFVSTKVGNDFTNGGPSVKNFHPEYLERAVHASRDRLTRPFLDLVHLHNPPAGVLTDRDVVRLVERLKSAGRVQYLGLSTNLETEIAALEDLPMMDAVQVPFNILRQEPFFSTHGALARWGGAVVVRTPLEHGLLAGSLRNADALDPRDYRRRAWARDEEASKRAATCELAAYFARQGSRSLAQAAIQFALLPACVSVVIPGCRSLEQLAENVAASREIPSLTAQDLREIDAIVRSAGLPSHAHEELAERARGVVPARFEATSELRGADLRIERLFTPLELGPVVLDNRIVRSGTTERAADASGLPTDDMKRIHVRLAAGGAGMIVTGFLAVDRDARASTSHCVLGDGVAVSRWSDIVDACRATRRGVILCAQLGHGGSRSLGTIDPSSWVESFSRAAERAVAAGFDAVQLHCAHGYLLSELIAGVAPGPRDGARTVELTRIVTAVRSAIGPRHALLVKLNMADFVPAGYDPRAAEEVVAALARLRIDGVDGIEWSAWTPSANALDSPSRRGVPRWDSEGFFSPFAARMKAAHPEIRMGSCGGYRSVAGMSHALEHWRLDFVALSRSLIAEPDLPLRLRAGAEEALCDGCNECTARHVRPVHCPRLAELTNKEMS